MHAQVVARDAAPCAAAAGGAAALRRAGGGRRRGDARALRVARRLRARRRPDAQPVDLRAAGRHPRRARRGGRRAAQLAERRDGRRARRRAVRQGRAASSAARSQQAGLAAALALDPARSAADNVAAIDAALARLRTGAVAPAARDDGEGRFVAGDAIGFVDDAIVAWGEPAATLGAVLGELGGDAELLTCIAGAGAPLGEDGVRALVPAGVELECEDGGQPAYWWLVAAE